MRDKSDDEDKELINTEVKENQQEKIDSLV
jgi:hypothetical protein